MSMQLLASPARFTLAEGISIDLTETPHWLVAGATGQGKSVMVNSILMQAIRHSPEHIRLALVDLKRVELAPYKRVPHLWRAVATEPDDAVDLLEAAVREMEVRYVLLEAAGVRHVDKLAVALPRLLVVVDELADLVLQRRKRVEPALMRLTQLGRAAGVHVLVATQRPSVDVVTGVLKANLPGRIALRTASTTDSRVVLDEGGAEGLSRAGEFICRSGVTSLRGRGAYVSEDDVAQAVADAECAWATDAEDEAETMPVRPSPRVPMPVDASPTPATDLAPAATTTAATSTITTAAVTRPSTCQPPVATPRRRAQRWDARTVMAVVLLVVLVPGVVACSSFAAVLVALYAAVELALRIRHLTLNRE